MKSCAPAAFGAPLSCRDRIAGDDVVAVRDWYHLDLVLHRGHVGDVHHAGIGLGHRHPCRHPLHVRFAAGVGDGGAGFREGLGRVPPDRDSGRGQGDRHPGAREVGEALHLLRVSPRHDDREPVVDEWLRNARDVSRVPDLLHVLVVGRREHVGRCTLDDLPRQRRRAGEVELDLGAGMRRLEVLADRAEGLGQRRRGEDGHRRAPGRARQHRQPEYRPSWASCAHQA